MNKHYTKETKKRKKSNLHIEEKIHQRIDKKNIIIEYIDKLIKKNRQTDRHRWLDRHVDRQINI